MSSFSGKQFKGAKRIRQELKHEEADERNARTLPNRRASYRRASTDEQQAVDLLTELYLG